VKGRQSMTLYRKVADTLLCDLGAALAMRHRRSEQIERVAGPGKSICSVFPGFLTCSCFALENFCGYGAEIA